MAKHIIYYNVNISFVIITVIGLKWTVLVMKLSVIIGEQKTSEELGKISPFRALPVMDDNGFHLTERYSLLIN